MLIKKTKSNNFGFDKDPLGDKKIRANQIFSNFSNCDFFHFTETCQKAAKFEKNPEKFQKFQKV